MKDWERKFRNYGERTWWDWNGNSEVLVKYVKKLIREQSKKISKK